MGIIRELHTSVNDYRVLVKVQNGRIFERIRAAGFATVRAFCKSNDLPPSEVGQLLNLKISPTRRNGDFKSIVVRISNALSVDPVDLFTERQYEPVPSNVKDFLIDEAHVNQLIQNSNSPERMLALVEMADAVKIKAKLTDKETKVINMRFNDESTLDECSRSLGVTRERVRQIETKALRKMRRAASLADIVLGDLGD